MVDMGTMVYPGNKKVAILILEYIDTTGILFNLPELRFIKPQHAIYNKLVYNPVGYNSKYL